MRKRRVLKAVYLLFAAISAASFAPPVEAQIDFKLKTNSGSVSLFGKGETGCNRGVLDGCTVSMDSVQNPGTLEFIGFSHVNAGAQTLSVSGQLAHSGIDQQYVGLGGVVASYTALLFADVPPGVYASVVFRRNISLQWSMNSNEVHGDTSGGFTPYPSSYQVGGGFVVTSVPSGTPSEVLFSTVIAMARGSSPIIVDGGKTYYYLGAFNTFGRIEIQKPEPAGGLGAYSSSIDNIEVRRIGKVLKKLPAGDAQTGLVTKPLPKGLNVRVINDDTGIPVSNEPVTFTILSPVNGATLSATSVNTNLSGYATTYLTLGASTGTYTVRADCPGCLMYVNTATFTATAISSFTDVTGVVPEGCTQVAIGERTAQVDPVTNSFRIFHVPLVINSPVNLFSPEIIVTCNNDAECPVANAQRMPDTCAGGNFGAPRRKGETHNGIDLRVGDGVSILSATQGTVVYIGQYSNKRDSDESWGTVILIQSTRKVGGKYEVLMYGHLDPKKLHVRTGDPVSVGQEIAVASLGGASGNIRSVLDGNPPIRQPRPQCLHVHVERRLLAEPLSILGFPVPCAIPSDLLMAQCESPDMNSNGNSKAYSGNGGAFGGAMPTDPDDKIGCNVYK